LNKLDGFDSSSDKMDTATSDINVFNSTVVDTMEIIADSWKHLKSTLINAWSTYMYNKLSDLYHLLYGCQHDIILVTETCDRPSIPSSIFDHENIFHVIMRDRVSGR
jgi:hypothetical protein